MIRLFQVLIMAFALAGPIQAEEATPLRNVISGQIAAFAEDDFTTALEFASPRLQRVFGTGERFGDMVRAGFPMVYRPDQVTFLSNDQDGPVRHQIVMIRDLSGRIHFLDYEMGRDETGWHIRGVMIIDGEVT